MGVTVYICYEFGFLSELLALLKSERFHCLLQFDQDPTPIPGGTTLQNINRRNIKVIADTLADHEVAFEAGRTLVESGFA